MLTPSAIHQFSISCQPGDGITNGMLLTQRLLQRAGIPSEIYCADIAPELKKQIKPLKKYQSDPSQILLIHHGIGNGHEDWLKQLKDRRFMVFHNITPSSFFAADHPIQPMLSHGWQQLDSWKNWLDGAIADSEQNLQHLLEHGYPADKCRTIPLLVDLENFSQPAPSNGTRPLEQRLSLLFVGRLMPHKNQAGLIEAVHHLSAMLQQPVHLSLVGSTADTDYVNHLHQLIRHYKLENSVTITGKVSQAQLSQHYQQADIYISLSRHEGFGMPLIEAMAQQLPVLAYNAPDSNIRHTLSDAGLLLESDHPAHCAAALAELASTPRLRTHLNSRARQHLQQFQPQALYNSLRSYMAAQQISLPDASFPEASHTTLKYRLAGPFDSSYSLALVNRELARALNRLHPGKVGLYATEGPGDIKVNKTFLARHPDCAAMHQLGQQPAQIQHEMRLLYPPRVSAMQGEENGLTCYGWEESVLPRSYIQDFNNHLTYATSMSSYVSKTLQDNGLSCPIYTTGIGADHILQHQPDASPLPALHNGLRLLHISSCFPRKGVDCLLEAYGSRFSADDNISLIIKTFPNPHHDIKQQLADWRKKYPAAPRVTLINKDLPDSAIRALYNAADVLVAPSRGEGFGLPMAEAMLHHLPVITTGYGGQTDFCTPDTAWLIDYRFALAETHMEQSSSCWVEPDSQHLGELLNSFYQHYSNNSLQAHTQARLEAAHQLISQHYSWDSVAQRLDQQLARLPQQPLLNASPKLACITTWNSKCGIATYSDLLLGPALGNTLILANSDAELTAQDNSNVIRCWQANQQESLAQVQQQITNAGIEQVLIQFNFSFFNLQALKQLLSNLHQQQIQTLITFHSTADVYWGDELKTLRDLLPELQKVSRIFVHGTDDLNRLKEFGLSANTCLFPHGVKRQPMAELSQPTPEHLQHKQIIASYGFLLPHKGIKQLIEGFADYQQQQPDSHLLLINAEYPASPSRKERKACQALIKKHKLQQQVTLVTDYLSDEESLGWLSLADLIVFPYQQTQESSSAAVRWGLASERPVLCTPLPIFEDVQDAVLFSQGTEPPALAQALHQHLNSNTRQQISDQQQRWLAQHDWNTLSQRLKHLLLALHTARATAQP